MVEIYTDRYDVGSSHNNIGSKIGYWELLHQCWVFHSKIWGNFKHNIGYNIGSSHNNILYDQKTGYWKLVYQCWYLTVQNFKHNIAYDIGSSQSMLMYIACLCPNLVSVHFYAIPT